MAQVLLWTEAGEVHPRFTQGSRSYRSTERGSGGHIVGNTLSREVSHVHQSSRASRARGGTA